MPVPRSGPVARNGPGLALAALLAGCVPAAAPEGPPIRALALYDGAAIARGPADYCVDATLSRPSRGFAVLASCAVTAADGGLPWLEGLVLIQIGAEDSAAVSGGEEALAALLRTLRGAALLSEAGRPETIRLDRIETEPGLVLVHFIDSAEPPVPGLGPEEWRAFLDIRGRLATVTIRSFARDPLSRREGADLLRLAVAALRSANTP